MFSRPACDYERQRGSATHQQEASSQPGSGAPKHLYWAQHRERTPLLVVEGQADAITAWQWGYNAVALCGSSLGEPDVEALRGYPAVYLALDANEADKIPAVADALGPLTMSLPELPGSAGDLNAWLQAGGTREGLAALVEKARPWIEVTIEQASQAPAYALEKHLDHLARLVSRLAPGTRGRYVR